MHLDLKFDWVSQDDNTLHIPLVNGQPNFTGWVSITFAKNFRADLDKNTGEGQLGNFFSNITTL